MTRSERMVLALAKWHRAEIAVHSEEYFGVPAEKAYCVVYFTESGAGGKPVFVNGHGAVGGFPAGCKAFISEYVGKTARLRTWSPAASERMIAASSEDELELKMKVMGLL